MSFEASLEMSFKWSFYPPARRMQGVSSAVAKNPGLTTDH